MEMVIDTAVKYNDIFMSGVKITIIISILSCFFGLLLGIVLAFMKISGIKILQAIAAVYVEIIRGTPVLVQLFVVFYGLPSLGVLIDPFPAAVACFAINEGAYCAETIRAALESVPAGQMDAGYCVGMT